jgi:ribosomal protein S6--L-glutamate ligase
MRVALVHADRPPAAVTRGIVARLSDRGVAVDVLHPGRDPFDVTRVGTGHDLHVLKHSDEACLSVAAALHATGAATFNPYPAVAACRDKAVATRLLAHLGLPVPETHLVAEPEAAAPLLRGGVLVVKPTRGSKGRGVQVVSGPAELAAIDPADGPFLVQRHHPPQGLDRKLYRIGAEIFCVGRPWPAVSREDKLGVLLDIDPLLRRIAVGVGEALGIDVYGADVISSDGTYWLVDVSSFPGFKGVPDAGHLLAERVLAAVRSTKAVA